MELAEAIEAYAAYLNGRHRAADQYDAEALAEFETDLARARWQLEVAWLEHGLRA